MTQLGRIKVLETIRQGKIGGGETHVLDLVSELNKDIFEPVVLSFTEGPMVDQLKKMGVKTYVIPTETPFDVTKWKKVKELMEQEDIRLVHAHGTRANSNIFWAASQLKLPLVYTVHGWSFHADQGFFVKSYRTLGERLLTNMANLTICVSEDNLREGSQYFEMPNARVIQNGINLKKFNPQRNFTDIRAELGIAPHEVVIGYIARITTQKDPCTLVKALAKIPANIPVKCLMIGDGDLKDDAQNLARELGVENRIIFLPFRQDVPDVLNAIDIYCLPSLWEGLPIGLLEAMAMQKAVVATNIDGTKEVIKHNSNGLLVPPQDPDALAQALLLLAEDKELRKMYGAKARATVVTQYDLRKMARSVEAIYASILKGDGAMPALPAEKVTV
jgi:glycosyltransferase involved in cell wall biosynthesis